MSDKEPEPLHHPALQAAQVGNPRYLLMRLSLGYANETGRQMKLPAWEDLP